MEKYLRTACSELTTNRRFETIVDFIHVVYPNGRQV